MKLLKFIFIIFLLPLISNTCDHDDYVEPPPPKDTLYVNDTFLRYWYFPVGSWWVYKKTDTTAEIYDTVKITNTFRKLEYHPSLSPYMSEYVGANYEHNCSCFKDLKPLYQLFSNQVDPNVVSSTKFVYPGYSMFFSWPIDSLKINLRSNGASILIDTFSITLPVGKLHNVVHLFIYQKDHLWITKDVGIIKYKYVQDSSTWELINYSIKN